MRKLGYALPIVLASLFAGCTGVVVGSGHVVTEDRKVSGFSGVELSGHGKLVIDQNGDEGLTVTADDNVLKYITSEVRDGRLRLGTEGLVNLRPSLITYKLSAKNLRSILASGSTQIDAKSVHTDELTIAVSGSGDVDISGTATRQTVALSGSANYRAGSLETQDTSIAISGSAKAVLAARGKLDVQVSGSGDVE